MKTTDIELHNIIMQIPKNTSELTITAKIIEGDKVVKVQGVYNINEIFQARKDFLDYVDGGDDYNATYSLTDEGRAYVEELIREGRI